ncbi:MAG: FprA family A-type flavoprotein [Bacillota bacterium]
MKAVSIKDGVYWVGAKNPDLRVFDIVMRTDNGTTYNSYLVKGEKAALVETVKRGFEEELISRVESIMPLEEIEYIIMNHTEPDHSGSLGYLLKRMPRARVVASKVALKFLREMVNYDFPQMAVTGGGQIDLGDGKILNFISAPFLHWPDSMFTYLPSERVLFTCDVFGCHYCGKDIFNDLTGDMDEAFRYYYDVIMSPFANYVTDAINKIEPLDFDTIAPSHGPVLRKNIMSYVEKYRMWASGSVRSGSGKVLVAYVSAYGNTKLLAEEISGGINETGLEAQMIDISTVSPGEVAGMVNAADGFLVGSPTLNRDAVYPVWDMLARVSPVINQGKPAAAFGSYGWSGEAVKMIEQRLSGLQFKVFLPGIKVNFTPDERTKTEAREFGRSFGRLILNK